MKSAGVKLLGGSLIVAALLSSFTGKTYAQDASLTMSPSTGTYSVGSAVPLAVKLNTAGETSAGVDVVLEYDTTKLQFVSITEQSGYQYPTKSEAGGTILVSVNSLTGITGSDITVFTVNFTALAQGTTSVEFVTSGALTTGVFQTVSGDDLLGTATGGTYTITAAAEETPPSQVGKGTTTPSTGVFDSMNVGLMIGISLFVIGGLASLIARKAYKE